ncbi:hypothetical protein NE237_027866 [Protea cynaroides]|uniref:Uncharacterized protein n=1 Tax=Protea cynaroides TaxID=273540 RepID=A0A9Q0JSC1_9MAGN|nr:hypothetical protein NE237_027866 [Protea cynaroides]
MWLKSSLAGNVLAELFLINPHAWKSQMRDLLDRAVELIRLRCLLLREIILDGNGLRIPDWIVLVSGAFPSNRTHKLSNILRLSSMCPQQHCCRFIHSREAFNWFSSQHIFCSLQHHWMSLTRKLMHKITLDGGVRKELQRAQLRFQRPKCYQL